MGIICIRGAVTVQENSRDEILAQTEKMLLQIFEENSVKADDIISILFTATADLDQIYPAVAGSQIGVTNAL